MAQKVKEQLQTAQAQHKNDLETLRKQASAAKKETQRYQALVDSHIYLILLNFHKLGPFPKNNTRWCLYVNEINFCYILCVKPVCLKVLFFECSKQSRQ